jgi:RNA polymerase sigma-70 factor (ECF subfamily)
MSSTDHHVVSGESELIARAVEGDADAFGQLVKSYQARLFTTVMHIVGCRNDAEDIVQEAFLQAYINLRGFRGTSGFYTWLYRIAVNRALSRNRHRRVRQSLEAVRDVTVCEPPDPGDGPGARLMRREHAAAIQKALGTLSEQFRAILVLRGIDELDYQAIGEVLNLTPGTVRSRLHRARMQLREQLSEAGYCQA